MKDTIKMQSAMKALIVNKNKEMLILREAKTDVSSREGLWQLPGGRVDPGEHFEDALRREIKEETGIQSIEILAPLFVGEWRPVIKGESHQIIAVFFMTTTTDLTVTLSHEHDQYKWICPEDYMAFEFAEPEGEVIETYLKRVKSK